jgi:vancomycin resistance protein VanW
VKHADNHPHPGKAADAILFAVKAGLLRVRRGLRDASDPAARRRPTGICMAGDVLAEVATPLYTDSDPDERGLQLGKVQNLRIGAKAIDGTRLEAGQVFSFWAQVGRPDRARGFVEGRELRQGCIIPTVAGGLCQLSNSLFRVAKDAGCEIVERHGHTAPIPNSPFPPGEDATVFWNYVDLRFRAPVALVVRVRLSAGDLIVRLEKA